MPQATLFSNATGQLVGNPITVKSPSSATIQFTPKLDGFTGTILIELSLTPILNSLWYPIVTIGQHPWFSAALVEFSSHTSVMAFSFAHLNTNNVRIRASVVSYDAGTISCYIAY